MTQNGSNRVRFGPFEADLRTRELWKENIRLRLSGQPFQILEVLLERPGELVTREELRSRIWQDDTFVDFSHGLNAAVNKLREALSDSAQNPRYIETLPRRGYRFIAPVDQVQIQAATSFAKPPISKLFPDVPPTPRPQSRVRRHSYYFIGVGALVALVILGALISRILSSNAEAHETGSLPRQIRPLTSIADSTGSPAFSPDGNYVAFYREGVKPGTSGIYVKQIGAEQLIQVTNHDSDCCPAWSPDKHFIAFGRLTETKQIDLYVTASGLGQQQASPGTERKLVMHGAQPHRGEIDWSPNGTAIAFDGGSGIHLLSLKDYSVRRITEVPPLAEDWGPVFSADGKRLLFVRSGETGVPDEIRILPAGGGDSQLVVSELGKIHGPPQWSMDGESVIFASIRNGESSLWRVSAEKRDMPVQVTDGGWHPAVARKGYRIAYQRLVRGLNVWQMDVMPKPGPDRILIASTSQTDQGPGPQFSPDGRKIAYMSDRSGTMEIWVADRDGSNAYQLTAVGSAGTPRWSPDSRSIVFDAHGKNTSVIYTINLEGGPPRQLTEDTQGFESVCPSWSRDRKWIYFASTRTKSYQVWKVPAAGGTPMQVTKQGGHAAFESPDGKYLYYAKTFYSNPAIWQVPVNGGKESPVTPALRPATWASWVVVDQGIIFAGPAADGRPVVSLYDFATHQVRQLATLGIVPFWLTATPNGKAVAFDKPGWQQSQVMLVENFR